MSPRRNALVSAATAYRSLAPVAALAADGAEPSAGAIVALLPTASDPIVEASSQIAHVTMAYLGEAADLADAGAIRDWVRDLAPTLAPIAAVPKSRGELGDAPADVVFVRGDGLDELRALLAADDTPVAAAIAVDAFEFNPHITLGYPDEPPAGDYDVDAHDEITFDRIAVWVGEDRQEYPLGDEAGESLEAAAAPGERLRWEGPLVFEGQVTGDGRMIAHGALYWADDLADNPLPYRIVLADTGAHDDAVVAGRILSIERRDDGVIWGAGDFDDQGIGPEAARLVREKLQDGVSVDLDDAAFEVLVASEVLAEAEAEADEVLLVAAAGSDPTADREYERMWAGSPDDELMVTTSARIRSVTGVAISAFADARIAIVDAPADAPADNGDEASEADDAESLVAAAAPVAPPRAWFSDPGLTGPTPLTITGDGRIFGHLASWNVCHIASPAGEGVCVVAPRSNMDYARFHTGSLRTAEGAVIGTGRITMGTGHAGPKASPAAAAAHYDNTGAAVADVRAGEDAFGIWVAGSIRPGVTPEQVRTLRASPLSGDWRSIDGNLELHAALAVNVPGFPIPRPAGMVASGALTSLVASGIVVSEESALDIETTPGVTLSASDTAYLARLIQRERQADAKALASRVNTARLAANRRKVEAYAARRKEVR